MYERDQGEVLRLKLEVTFADVTITGTETVVCELRKAGPVLTSGAAALSLTPTYVASPQGWVFEGSTAAVAPGTYEYGAWVIIGTERVSLGGGKVKINKNAAAAP